MTPPLYIIIGPTAVGKTKYAIELAKKVGGEIISADSMQVYKCMDIGTAKPSKRAMRGIPHHLINIKSPDEEWNVSLFVATAEKLIKEIRERGKIPIIIGGTGLYIWTFLEGFSFPIAPADEKIRARLSAVAPDKLYARLKKVDTEAAAKIHPNDKKRIIRALEVFELTGEKMSVLQKKSKKSKVRRPKSKVMVLSIPREKLYKKIEARVDKMIKKGLIKEVRGLLKKGYSKKLTSMQALGYKEIIDHLEGNCTKEEAIELIKKRTRHFARRQLVWFRRFKTAKWVNV